MGLFRLGALFLVMAMLFNPVITVERHLLRKAFVLLLICGLLGVEWWLRRRWGRL